MKKNHQNIYQKISVCRLCLSSDLQEVLDLGEQPPANSLREDLQDSVPCAPLKLVHCGCCSVVQLTATVDPLYLFSQYVWVTATSATARAYSETYCTEVLNRSGVKSPFVVEIASNDGTFLKQFKENGCEVLGVDPAQNIATSASNAGIPTLGEFFDERIAGRILADYPRPSIVMARNVIPHVKEIHSIVSGMSSLIDDDGIVAIEFHYAKKIVDELHYDSIYHEHLFYFSIKSLTALFAQYALYSFDAFASPISGGSLVLFFSKKQKLPSAELDRLTEIEVRSGLNNLRTWQHFGTASRQHASNLMSAVTEYSNGEKLIGYGASARSSTMMNFVGISNSQIECIIDRNPIKHELYTPGTNIPIVSYEEGIQKLGKRNILLLAWNFEEEIVRDLRSSGFQGNIIVPLPNKVHIR